MTIELHCLKDKIETLIWHKPELCGWWRVGKLKPGPAPVPWSPSGRYTGHRNSHHSGAHFLDLVCVILPDSNTFYSELRYTQHQSSWTISVQCSGSFTPTGDIIRVREMHLNFSNVVSQCTPHSLSMRFKVSFEGHLKAASTQKFLMFVLLNIWWLSLTSRCQK